MTRFLRAVTLALCVMAAAPAAWADGEGDRAQRVVLASKLFAVMQGPEMDQAIRRLAVEMIPAEDATSESAEVRDAVAEMTVELMPRLFDAMAPVYADRFTLAELQAMLDFYDTEMGRTILRKTIEVAPALDEAVMAAMPSLMNDIADSLCARLDCTAEQRREMKAGIMAGFNGAE